PMGYLLARGTSREAQATARQMGVLPYCRASFERMGHEVGALYSHQRPRVEAALAETLEAPEGTHSVSVSLDRVAVPMEEPKKRPVGRPRKSAAQRPVDVVWHMAYAACLVLHDAQGEALGAVRYGRMPHGDARGL
ncbi:ISKra4 family transposase, partial [Corallococcus exiguus]|nr:ISKra4 family transposase [Corallococcus exiguus]